MIIFFHPTKVNSDLPPSCSLYLQQSPVGSEHNKISDGSIIFFFYENFGRSAAYWGNKKYTLYSDILNNCVFCFKNVLSAHFICLVNSYILLSKCMTMTRGQETTGWKVKAFRRLWAFYTLNLLLVYLALLLSMRATSCIVSVKEILQQVFRVPGHIAHNNPHYSY